MPSNPWYVPVFAVGWLNLARRLSKDYERLIPTSDTWIHLPMIKLMANRLA